MKRRIVLISLLIILIAIGATLVWPLSFSDLAPDCTSITIIHVDNTLEHSTKSETLLSGTDEFSQIQSILGKYSYHRSMRTFFSDTHMSGNHAGYWLYIYLDTGEERTFIVTGGTGEITIEDHVYRVGYFGDSAALAMMDDIVQILDF